MVMNLGDRLRQVISVSVPIPEKSGGHGFRSGNTEGPGFSQGSTEGWRMADILGGQWLESRDGAVLVVDRYYTPDRRHGRTRIGDIVETLEAGLDALQIMCRAWPGREPRPYTTKLCFFDLETTGLAGGAGTQAFLVGCACPEDGGLRLRQFLLPGFEHERALLALLAEWPNLGTADPRNPGTPEPCTLVSFNGRSFDVPLIETRYLFHRLAFPFGDAPHLDMLHPARRLWKQRPALLGPSVDEDSCRLSVLERHLAGYHRVGDVPAFEIPSRYFRFIRHGEVHPLEAVLEHNRIDLVSLALVTAHAIALITKGPCAASHPREAFGLGRVYERSGLPENAEASYAHAASLAARVGREPEVRAEALRRLALCRRRAGRPREAAEAWQELLGIGACPATLRREAREALAIHHEHRSRDLDTARLLVLDVLSEGAEARTRAAAEYRLRRIDRKIAVRAVRHEGGLLAALEESLN
jgi:uncharacterized protein YprB with RNaseH-like and TPR domain